MHGFWHSRSRWFDILFLFIVVSLLLVILWVIYQASRDAFAYLPRKLDADDLLLSRGEIISAFATSLTAFAIVGTVLTAFIAYKVNARTAKIQKTMDYISRQVHDNDIIEIFNASRNIKKKYSEKGLEISYNNVISESEEFRRVLGENNLSTGTRKTDSDYIFNLLNYYETWAIGIYNEALDESILRSWWRTALVNDWMIYKEFIEGHRKERRNVRAFIEFENLAKRWASTDEQNFC